MRAPCHSNGIGPSATFCLNCVLSNKKMSQSPRLHVHVFKRNRLLFETNFHAYHTHQFLFSCEECYRIMMPGCRAYWGWYKMADIFRIAFSNPLSWMKMLQFRFRYHSNDNKSALVKVMAPNRWQAVTWTNAFQVDRRIYDIWIALTAYLISKLLFLLHAFSSFPFRVDVCVCYMFVFWQSRFFVVVQ